MLNEIDKLLDASGFVLNTYEVLYDMDEEWKEGALTQHSEKLAIVFGLISRKPGTTVRIVKNLQEGYNARRFRTLYADEHYVRPV
ncbi:hypothetical protein K1719_039186 [Acacia pycnantha]|nr:hypothetical protein K1719_039186 [Acacia pycnantha]